MSGVRQKLDTIEFTNLLGLSTKVSQDVSQDSVLQIAKNTDFFTILGATSKPPGSALVLASIYKENSQAQKVSWIGQYKAADLDGQILRHVIIAAGTKLHKIESNGTLTALTGTGFNITETRTKGLFHSSDQYFDFLLIQNQDPDLVGNGDTPVKYDGKEITRWGIVPPGSVETVIEAYDSLSGFTFGGCTAEVDTTTTLDGKSIKFSATGTTATVESAVSAFAVNNTIADRSQISIYIPRGQIPNLAQGTGTPAISIRVGTDSTNNYHQFNFDRGELIEGWNPLALDFSSPDSTTGSPGVSALTNIQTRVNSTSSSSLISNFRVDKFLTFDTGAPTVVEGAAGSVFSSGDVYSYKIVYVSKYGNLSNAGPASVDTTLSQSVASIELSSIPVSSDNQVVARQIYRTVGNGAIHLFVATINNNSDTTYSDTTADTSLGATSPPLDGDVSDDNSPPLNAGIVKRWKDTIFLSGFPDRPEIVGFSDQNEPESFPTLNEVQLDGKITAIYETYSTLIIETETGKWQVSGENPDFRFDKIISGMGCVGRRAAGQTRILGYSMDREGIRLYDGNAPTKISELIRDVFDTDFNKANIELTHSSHSKNRNLITLFVPNSSGAYTATNYIYQYPVDDLNKGWWWQLDLPSSINLLHIAEIEDSNGDFRLYAGGDDGMVYELFKSGEKNWTLADGSTEAITTQFRTKYLRAAEPDNPTEEYTGRILPRMLELRYSGDQDATWTALIETSNSNSQGTALDNTTITFLFRENEGFLRLPVPAITPGEYVRITVTNSEKDIAGTITGMKLYFQPRPGQYPLISSEMNPSISQINE